MYPTVLSREPDPRPVPGSATPRHRRRTSRRSPRSRFTTSGLTVNVNGRPPAIPTAASPATRGTGATTPPHRPAPSPSHPYATAGTYTVTLTVTDNQGGTGSTSKQVTVTAVNQPPVGVVHVHHERADGERQRATSSDPDGSITGYSWNWGDNTAASTGAVTSHPYATAGTYTVTLTVTDNQGATGSTNKQVTVTASTSRRSRWTRSRRTTTNGFGTRRQSVGPGRSPCRRRCPWTAVPPGSRSPAGTGRRPTSTRCRRRTSTRPSTSPPTRSGTGGGIYQSLVVRRIGTSDYRLKLRITATTVDALPDPYRQRRRDDAGRPDDARVSCTSPGWTSTYGCGSRERDRRRCRASAWVGGQPEPATWNVTTTDATAALQGPGAVGLYSYLSGSANNPPVTIGIDDFESCRRVPLTNGAVRGRSAPETEVAFPGTSRRAPCHIGRQRRAPSTRRPASTRPTARTPLRSTIGAPMNSRPSRSWPVAAWKAAQRREDPGIATRPTTPRARSAGWWTPVGRRCCWRVIPICSADLRVAVVLDAQQAVGRRAGAPDDVVGDRDGSELSMASPDPATAPSDRRPDRSGSCCGAGPGRCSAAVPLSTNVLFQIFTLDVLFTLMPNSPLPEKRLSTTTAFAEISRNRPVAAVVAEASCWRTSSL